MLPQDIQADDPEDQPADDLGPGTQPGKPCDPLAEGLLQGWRSSTDEQLMQAMLPAWTGE